MNRLGPYELLRRMGAGATAEVYLAAGPNPRDAELIALKLVLPHLAEDESLREMLLREARTSSLLRHPNLVEIFEVGDVEGRPFLAMEFVPGWSVSAFEKKLKAASTRLTPSEACYLVAEAAKGLHYAHEVKGQEGLPLGLIHRDVSPQNLILSEEGRVKVVDFGLAKATNSGTSARTGGIKGKLPYMPPEQLRAQALDRRLDVFALGAVLWELCTGTLLYPGKTEAEIFQQALFLPQPHPDEVARGLPRQLVDVLLRAVERDVQKRIPTADALARALEPLILPDAAAQLARRMREHFEPLPKSAGVARGLPPTPKAAARPKPVQAPVLPRPPQRGRARELAPPDATRLDVAPPGALADATQLDRRAPPREDATLLQTHSPFRTSGPRPAPAAEDPSLEQTVRRPVPRAPAPAAPTDPLLVTSPDLPPPRSGDTNPELRAPDATVPTRDASAARAGRTRALRRWAPAVVIALALPTVAITATVLVKSLPLRLPVAVRGVPEAPEAEPNELEHTGRAPPREPGRPRGKGTLVLQADAPAFVRANGKDLGMTPLTASFPAGPLRLQVSTVDGKRSVQVEVTILAGEQVSRRVQLAP